MGDRLRAGKLSRYATSHPGQLSLTIPPWVCAVSTSLGWEGRSCRHTGHATLVVYPPTGSTAYEREMSTPPTLLRSMALLYLHLYLTSAEKGTLGDLLAFLIQSPAAFHETWQNG